MSKLTDKLNDARDNASHAILSAAHRRGPKALAVANTASRLVFGRYWEDCDLGADCPDPRHDHDR